MLPGAAFERDPTVDYQVHMAALYTMTTCHSLRVVEGELVGDPLDVKMFGFTGWSFEESRRKTSTVDLEELDDDLGSIARPPAGLTYGIDDPTSPAPVCTPSSNKPESNCVLADPHRAAYLEDF